MTNFLSWLIRKKTSFFLLLYSAFLPAVYGQDNRVRDANGIGWLVYQGDHAISKKWKLHTEYQWRRTHFITTWQQALARLGAVYSLTDKVTFSGGYTSLTTYPYGAYPEANAGKPNPEHRLYEDVELDNSVGPLALSHRIRLEQRYTGEWSRTPTGNQLEWLYLNRIRYRLKGTFPGPGQSGRSKGPYATFYDELFVGFGKNVGLDVFDQNRIYFAIGYQFSEACRLEGGYLNQITQHSEPEPVSEKPIFEANHGVLINVYYDLDFRRK